MLTRDMSLADAILDLVDNCLDGALRIAEGHIVVTTFGPSGPDTCSGLPVARYSPEGIHDQFGNEFRKVGSESEVHRTPWGSEQEFVYCWCRVAG